MAFGSLAPDSKGPLCVCIVPARTEPDRKLKPEMNQTLN